MKNFRFPTICSIQMILLLIGLELQAQETSSSPASKTDRDSHKPNTNLNISGNDKDQNVLWAQMINAKADSLEFMYTADAIKINRKGEVLNGRSDIAAILKRDSFQIDSISTLKNIIANRDSTYTYEIGTFWTKDGKKYKHLIIWNTLNQPKKRELECIAEAGTQADDLEKIDARCKEWIALCNENKAEGLVNELYAENAIYYNHKPVVLGRASIAKEYRYMNDPAYTLSLKSIVVEMVTSTLAFEIGQCSGSYNGKYVLIWKKNTSGVWEILMDSNI